jgi:hypothetical protein
MNNTVREALEQDCWLTALVGTCNTLCLAIATASVLLVDFAIYAQRAKHALCCEA